MTTVDVREDGDRDLIFVSQLQGLSILKNERENPTRDPAVGPWPEYPSRDQQVSDSDRLFAIEGDPGDNQFHILNVADRNSNGIAHRYNVSEKV